MSSLRLSCTVFWWYSSSSSDSSQHCSPLQKKKKKTYQSTVCVDLQLLDVTLTLGLLGATPWRTLGFSLSSSISVSVSPQLGVGFGTYLPSPEVGLCLFWASAGLGHAATVSVSSHLCLLVVSGKCYFLELSIHHLSYPILPTLLLRRSLSLGAKGCDADMSLRESILKSLGLYLWET